MGAPELEDAGIDILKTKVLRWDHAVSLIANDGTPPNTGPRLTVQWSVDLRMEEESGSGVRVAANVIARAVEDGKIRLYGLRDAIEDIDGWRCSGFPILKGLRSDFFTGVEQEDYEGWCWVDENEEQNITYSDLAVSWDDFISVFPWCRSCEEPDAGDGANGIAQSLQAASVPRGKGGRPPKYKWDEFYLELIRIANTPDGLPDKQADLERHMLEWCASVWGQEPAGSVIRSKLAPVYKRTEALPKTDPAEIGPADN